MKKPKSKRKIFVPVTAVVVIVAIGFGLIALGKSYAEEILNELVKRESNGFYKLNFGSLDLDVLDRRITINVLKLDADSTQGFKDLGLSTIYEVELGQLLIDFKSIIGFYVNKELEISNIRIVDPNITMVKLDQSKKRKFSLEAGNLYQAISDYMEVLKIDYFRIQDGSLAHHPSEFTLGNIDFVVQNLMMDSIGRENSVFYSESIELEIRNQKFNLPDGIHTLTFDSFVLSTKDSLLRFKNFQLMPTSESGVTFEGKNEINVYHIQIPELALKGVDYVAAYQDNELKVDELFLTKPIVYIDDDSHGEGVEKERDNSVLSLLFNVFNTLEIGKLSIDDASIDLKLDGEESYQRFKAGETNLVFHKIRIDSSTYRFASRNKYFEDIELDIHNYRYFLPDSVHIMSFDLLKINSINSELIVKNLGIKPSLSTYSDMSTVALELPSLEIHGIDYRKALLDKHLSVDTLSVRSTGLELFGKRGEKNGKVKVDSIYKAIQPFFRIIDIENFFFEGSALALSEDVQIGRVSLSAKQLNFNPQTRFWSQLLGDMDLKVDDFSLFQDDVNIHGERMGANGNLSSFYFKNWKIRLNNDKQRINGTIDSLLIQEVNIDSILHGKVNYFRKAIVIRPDITFDITSADNTSRSPDHIEKELIIVDASIKGSYNDLILSLDSLNADVFLGDSTAFRSLDSRNIEVRSAKLNHVLKMSRLDYLLESGEMDFHNIEVNPIKVDSSVFMINAIIPLLGVMEFEQSKFFDYKLLSSSMLMIQEPLIEVFIPKSDSESGTSSDSVSYKVDLALVDFQKGRIKLTNQNSNLRDLNIDNISLQLSDLRYPNEIIDEERVLFSEGVKLSIEHLKPVLTSNEIIDLHGIKYNTDGEHISVDSIYYESSDGSLKTKVYETNLIGMNADAFYREEAVFLKSLTILRVVGENRKKTDADEKGDFEFNTPLVIKDLSIRNIDWSYLNDQKDYKINSGYLFIEGVESKDSLTIQDLPGRIDKLEFGGRKLALAVDNGYRVEIDSYQLRHPEHSVDLNGVKLSSKYTKEEYSDIIQYQNDWFDVTADRIQFKDFNLDEYLADKTYQLDRINVDGVNALIYRDKAVPFNEKQVRNLPQTDLRNLGIPLQIDTVSVTGDLVYQEKTKNYQKPGEITFNDLNINLFNIKTTDIADNGLMILRGDGKLMDTGPFEVDGIFNLSSPNDQFSLNGKLTDFPLDSMNRILVPVANARIDQGYSEQLLFNFIANDTLAHGEMKFWYDNLHIQILNAETHEVSGLGAGLKTFFANTFVLRNQNPSFLFFLRDGTIFQKRDTSKAIFNFWGKALLSGAVSSVGIHKADKKERKFEKEIDEDL